MSKFMNSWTTFNEPHYFAKTKPDTVGPTLPSSRCHPISVWAEG
jgi:hypothetical protein